MNGKVVQHKAYRAARFTCQYVGILPLFLPGTKVVGNAIPTMPRMQHAIKSAFWQFV